MFENAVAAMIKGLTEKGFEVDKEHDGVHVKVKDGEYVRGYYVKIGIDYTGKWIKRG